MEYELYNGNCLDVMRTFPNCHVDTIITSPPYNMNLRIMNGKHTSRQIVKELTTKYESFDDNLTMEDYYDFNDQVISECLRISNFLKT